MRQRFGFRCSCGGFSKTLYGCDVTFEGKTVNVLFCIRCLLKFGLKERKKNERP